MANENHHTTGVAYTTSRVLAHLYWPTTMRARPFDQYSAATAFQVLHSGGSWSASSSVNIRASRTGARLDITTASAFTNASPGGCVEVRMNSAGPDWYGVCAELPIATNVDYGGVYS